MANAKEFFLSVTQRIFSNWTALKMAVEYGMGPRERAVDFCPYITEVIFMNGSSTFYADKNSQGLDSSEVATELEEYMDEQFSTELQDDSAAQVAEELLRFYRYCVENNEALALTEFEKLPAVQSWLLSNEPVRRAQSSTAPNDDDSSSESEEVVNGGMEVADDEWTEVRTRRKR